jgi:hypothetical protein
LDINLEDELTRFRAKQANRDVDLQSMAADTATSWEQQSGDGEAGDEIITAEFMPSAIHSNTVNKDDRDLRQSSGFVIIDGIDPPRANLTALTLVNEDPANSYGSLNLHCSPRGEITSPHTEYSASSQELLRQIQSSYTTSVDIFSTRTQQTPTPTKRKLFTPMTIGLVAAACTIAGGATYTYFNPAILAPLTATKTIAPTTTTSSLGQSIQSPNLAANEFSELNLSTLNTLKMPTAASANTSTAANPSANQSAGAPVAIPFNGMNATAVPPTTIVSQPRLADSLVRALLPPNFHILAKQTRYRSAQPGLRR